MCSDVGGCDEQIKRLIEVVELPLLDPDKWGCLTYGCGCRHRAQPLQHIELLAQWHNGAHLSSQGNSQAAGLWVVSQLLLVGQRSPQVHPAGHGAAAGGAALRAPGDRRGTQRPYTHMYTYMCICICIHAGRRWCCWRALPPALHCTRPAAANMSNVEPLCTSCCASGCRGMPGWPVSILSSAISPPRGWSSVVPPSCQTPRQDAGRARRGQPQRCGLHPRDRQRAGAALRRGGCAPGEARHLPQGRGQSSLWMAIGAGLLQLPEPTQDLDYSSTLGQGLVGGPCCWQSGDGLRGSRPGARSSPALPAWRDLPSLLACIPPCPGAGDFQAGPQQEGGHRLL